MQQDPTCALRTLRAEVVYVGTLRSLKNCGSHIDASHSRQPLVKGERLVRYEVNAVMKCNRRLPMLHIAICESPPFLKLVRAVCFQRRVLQLQLPLKLLLQVRLHKVQNRSCTMRKLQCSVMLPQRVRSHQLCAMPALRSRASEQAREDTSPDKS